MLVDDYIREERKRLDRIQELKQKGSEREAQVEIESLGKWQKKVLGFGMYDTATPGQLLKLMMSAKKGEIND